MSQAEPKATRSFEEFLNSLRDWSPSRAEANSCTIFDEIPIEEIRQRCLGNIRNVEWLTERVKTYLGCNDFKTVFMLLRTLAGSGGELSQPKILQLMVDVTKKCLEDFHSQYYLKDALVILCGKIYYSPQLYDEEVRKVFQNILTRYDRKGKYGVYEEEARILMRIFLTIGKVGDKTFLSLLRKNIPDTKNLNHLMEYTHTCKDEIAAEGVRMLLIRYFENLEDS